MRTHRQHGGRAILTRTSGALDSFVAGLGGDVVYERRCVSLVEISLSCTYEHVQPALGTGLTDGKVPAQEWLFGGQDIRQARPRAEPQEVS